jgi:LysR family nitrogen assimilation transcriptional regulator
VTVRIIEGLGRFLEEWLRLGKLDVAILTDLGDTEAFRIARIAREEMVLVAAPSTWPDGPATLTLKEAAALNLTITHGFRTVVDRLIQPTGLVMHYAEEYDSIPLILDRILSHPLVTILPHGFVRNDEIAGKLKVCRIVDPRLTRDLLLASNPRRAHTAAMQAVGNIIRARIADVLVH